MGRQKAKRISDPRVAYPEVKVQVRDLVRVWVLLPPLSHWGYVPGENLFYRAPLWGGVEWAQETCAGCPQQRYATEEPGKVQGPDRVGIVGSCGYRARRVNSRGKFVLSKNLGYKTRWVAK